MARPSSRHTGWTKYPGFDEIARILKERERETKNFQNFKISAAG